MIFKEFVPIHMQNIIKEKPKYDSIINDHLKLMYRISQSMNEPIQATYPYLSLAEYITIMMNTRQRDKEVLVDYTKRLKQ